MSKPNEDKERLKISKKIIQIAGLSGCQCSGCKDCKTQIRTLISNHDKQRDEELVEGLSKREYEAYYLKSDHRLYRWEDEHDEKVKNIHRKAWLKKFEKARQAIQKTKSRMLIIPKRILNNKPTKEGLIALSKIQKRLDKEMDAQSKREG